MDDKDFLLQLVNHYPILLYGLLIVVAVFIFLAVFQNRGVSIFGLKLGHKPQLQPPVQPHQSVTQSQNVNFYSGTGFISQEQINEIVDRIEKMRGVRRYQDALYKPPTIPERVEYLLAVRYDIERKIRRIVLSHGGGWAGSSMAGFDIFFDLANTHKLIPESLGYVINDFYYYSQALINQGTISDEEFLNIQALAINIAENLDNVPLGNVDDD